MAEDKVEEVKRIIPKSKSVYIFCAAGAALLIGAVLFGAEGKAEPGLGLLSGVMFGISSGIWFLRRKIKNGIKSLAGKIEDIKDLEPLIPSLFLVTSWMIIGIFILTFWTLSSSTLMLFYGAIILGQGFSWFYQLSRLNKFKAEHITPGI